MSACTGHTPVLECKPGLGWTCVKCGHPYNQQVDARANRAEHGFEVLLARITGPGSVASVGASRRTHRVLGVPVDPNYR